LAYLETIHTPADLKGLSHVELESLCQEIREFLITHVSETGGHLASNLGAVELTVALHRIFDTSTDRLMFDVGHQCYVHKLLTGRMNAFSGLRSYGGLAGFPKPIESVHDAYIAGHASDSVSIGLGMARACQLLNDTRHIICVIGDGAMTGGLAWEALFDLGTTNLPMIVILNDNGMSINPNTGGIGRYLKRLRLKPSYRNLKNHYRSVIRRIPGGKVIYRITHRMKERLKQSVLKSSLFEDMGLEYSGPVDGHNLYQLEEVLNWAIDLKKPALVHVITQKGKGYPLAEKDPGKFHGIGPFNPKTGEQRFKVPDYSAVFGAELCRLGSADSAICAITAAMREGTGLGGFSALYPNRFFDVGIAEEHAVSMAGGMADRGLKPVFAVYSTFLQRSYDMLLHDIALAKQHVVFAVDRAGLVGADGETHHGLFDIAFLSSVPDMTILSPASFSELRCMLKTALYDIQGPVAVRYPRGSESELYTECHVEPLTLLRDSGDIALLTYGVSTPDCIKAADILESQGIDVCLIKLGRLSPLPVQELLQVLNNRHALVCVEEVASLGCIGSLVAALLEQNAMPMNVRLLNTGDGFITHGSVECLRKLCGIDCDSIVRTVKELL